MGATVEMSLYIGLLKTRFDLFDDVKLVLKDGTIIEGEIAELDMNSVTIEESSGTYKKVYVDDIKDYIVP